MGARAREAAFLLRWGQRSELETAAAHSSVSVRAASGPQREVSSVGREGRVSELSGGGAPEAAFVTSEEGPGDLGSVGTGRLEPGHAPSVRETPGISPLVTHG